jgi:hypothetical protein
VYNGTQLIQAIQRSIGSANTTVTIYTWIDDNLTEIKSGTVTTVLEYDLDQPNSQGNYLEAVNLSQGYSIFRTKNRVKSISSGIGVADLTYSFDDKNNITSILFVGASAAILDFTYECD